MSMNLDKPLDDIIKSNPKKERGPRGNRGRPARRSSGGGARAAALGKGAGGAAQSAAALAAANRAKAPIVIPGRTPGGKQGSKIIVGNLPLDVTESQVKDLFASSIGPLRRVNMSYKANGTSTGQCTVEFQRTEDGNRAYQTYNNRLIDGKKALRIEVVVDPARAIQEAQAQAAQSALASGSPAAAAGRRTASRRGGRGARGGRGGGAGGRTKQPKKTAEELDAEMEDWSGQSKKEAPAA